MSESSHLKIKSQTLMSCEDESLYANTDYLVNSDEEESLYANVNAEARVRPVTLTSRGCRNSLFPQRKPKPLPKPPLHDVKPKPVSDAASQNRHGANSADKRCSLEMQRPESFGDVDEEPIYDDVYGRDGGTAFRTATSLTKLTSSLDCEETDLYEDVENECKSLPVFLEADRINAARLQINAYDQPLYGKIIVENSTLRDRSDSVMSTEPQDERRTCEGHSPSSNKSLSSSEKFLSIETSNAETEEELMLYENEGDIDRTPWNAAQSVEEENLYDKANTVDQIWFDRKEKAESLHDNGTLVGRGCHVFNTTQNEEPLYDEAATVLRTCAREQEELLYEEAAPVIKTHRKERATTEEPLYDEAATVLKDRLREQERVKESLYDQAVPVIKSRVEEQEEQEEPLYDDVAAPVLKKVGEPLYDKAEEMGYRARGLVEPACALYGTAVDVENSKLPLDERPSVSNKVRPQSLRCRKENPYRLAVSVRESFKEDSSDEEEPLYYNLLMVKMSQERCNQMFYENLDSQLTMRNLEKKAQRLCRLWGNAPAPKLIARTIDHHPPLKPVKSDTSVTVASVDYDENPVDSVDGMVLDGFMSHVAEGDRLMLRKWIVSHILESEKSYIGILDILFEHMQTFKSVANTDKSVINAKDNSTIFFKIPELHRSHFQFINSLGKIADNWSTGNQEVGTVFQKFASQEYAIAQEYLMNYQTAIKTVHRCWAENPVFAELTKVISVKCGKSGSMLSLEELLHKPIVRFQQNTLSMKDLIISTPLDHPDYDTLQRTLKSALNCLNRPNNELSFRNSNQERYLVKHGLLVEKAESLRRIRHAFLFSDVLICAKQKLFSRRRNLYERKWFIPLCDLQLEQKFSAQADKQSAVLHQQVVDGLEKELSRLQSDMKSEMKRSKKYDSSNGHQQNRRVDNLQKKIFQQEAALLEASPYLELRLLDKTFNQSYTFLMSSDYERTMWKEAISGMVAKVDASAVRISANEVSHLLEQQKIPKVIGSVLQAKDISLEKERLSGSLKITVHRLQGLTKKADAFCAIEIDSFGHVFMKAKTHQCNSQEPSWEEEFDIDLEGAQTLYLLCYKIGEETDHLIGKCSLVLSTAWLSETFKEQSIPLTDQVTIVISLQYTPQDKLMRRSLAESKGMFGVPLEEIAARENRQIPLFVTSCVEAIEADGLSELGLYRVSGLSSEVQRLKSAFDRNVASGTALLKTADVNVLTSLLKLFFRELPESLFTDAAYQKLVKGIGLVDPEAKEKFLVNTLKGVPKCNYATIMFMLDHLIRIFQNKDKNKMTLENLATVFGPTMLHPALLQQRPMTTEQRLWVGTNEIAAQATILLFFLKLKADNSMLL